ncbi:MAG: SDR family NAD(P)-dependent oxidoreductase [Ruminococcaceae bacterium]|nr:SDR family NAD(P)-dependent oxidoreductase [Oscillospiraceae bacterium]
MKKALITGGARGIGEAVSRALSKEGYYLYIHCNRSIDEAEALCAELGNAEYICADLSERESVKLLAERCGDIDLLVNNAGVALVAPFDSISAESARKMYEINLFAPIELTRAILPAMLKRKSGVIINISSVFGEVGGSCEVDYSAAKAGLIGFTKALAKEVGPTGIRVNCVCPGIIDTDMNGDLTFDDIEAICDEIPLLRMGEAEEVADCVAYLASDRALYITAGVFDVNGGWNG